MAPFAPAAITLEAIRASFGRGSHTSARDTKRRFYTIEHERTMNRTSPGIGTWLDVLRSRQVQRYGEYPANDRLDRDGTPQEHHNPATQGQPQAAVPARLAAGRVASPESLEDLRRLFGGNSTAGVGHPQHNLVARYLALQADRPAAVGVAHGIVKLAPRPAVRACDPAPRFHAPAPGTLDERPTAEPFPRPPVRV